MAIIYVSLPTITFCGDAAKVDFATAVAPILQTHCIRCHQPGNKKGDVSLATRADLIAGEHVVAGRPSESGLLDLIVAKEPGKKPRMPKTGEPLPAKDVAILRQWIAEGARWPADSVVVDKAKAGPDWWSLQPLAKATPPETKDLPEEWQANPIDRFVFAKLHAKGLLPAPPAMPHELIRRLTFDLTGLPPTPEEVRTFEHQCLSSEPTSRVRPGNQQSDSAYLQLTRRLLASKHYGERWGRHWLDVVRFGESNGYERNVLIDNVWPFRDYVIRSFNDDKPFDRFIREQLAGDVLGPGDPAVEVGTAFLVCGPYDDVGNQDPAQAAQIRADDMDEMIRATSEAFLGMTIGCARCHDHKFDPIKQSDYYRLYATFSGVVRGARVVASKAMQQERATREAKLVDRRNRLHAELAKLDESILSRADKSKSQIEAKWVRPPTDRYLTEERFEATEAKFVRLTVESRDDNPNSATGFHMDEFEVWTAETKPRNVALATAGGVAEAPSRVAEDFRSAYSPSVIIDGRYDQRLLSLGPQLIIRLPKLERIDRVTFSADRPRALQPGHSETTFVGDYRLDVSVDGKSWRQVGSSADRKPNTLAHRRRRLLELARTDADRRRANELQASLAKMQAEIAALPALPSWWVGQFRGDSGPYHVFIGGNPQKQGISITPGTPTFVEVCKPASMASSSSSAERRRALADWIVAPENPLTARVLANRLWHYHFGVGLVDTPADFGYMGSKPTHPELLDWLAAQIQLHGWRLKPLHQLIVMSRTYRQSAGFREGPARVDADSRLLWRFPPRRLSGEEIRDGMLSVAGKLDPRMGGPGFRLYRYLQDNVSTYVPLDRCGPETYRRAVYHQNARAARVDFLTDFDAPDCAFAASKRASTTTPLQALTLLNHPFTGDMAAFLVERLERESGKTNAAAQVERAFLLAYSRPPSKSESQRAIDFVRRNGLWPFCRALFNGNEFLHVN